MSLKEITKDLHADAERTAFAKKLLSGSISKEDYANYLYQMIPVYELIESGNKQLGFFANLSGIERAKNIRDDFLELAGAGHNFHLKESTQHYCQYLEDLLSDENRRHLIKAHLYCRHMGDLFGGQMIAKRVPGSGRFYEFENPEQLKMSIRAELTDDLGDEARVAFEWAIRMMRDLNDE